MVIGDPKIRFYVGFPLITAPNLAIGALCIADHKPRKFTDEDALLLKSIGTLLIERSIIRKRYSLPKKNWNESITN